VKPPLSKIQTREEFQRILKQTRKDMSKLAEAQPLHPLWKSMLAQLRAMEEWSKDGRVPTQEERDKIIIGVQVVRELEPVEDDAMYDLTQRLHELQYFFQEHL
jgi:hypothetical protein